MGRSNDLVKFLAVLGAGPGQPGGTGCPGGREGGLGAAASPGTEPAAEMLSQKFSLKTGALCLRISCALQLLDCCMEGREEAPD